MRAFLRSFLSTFAKRESEFNHARTHTHTREIIDARTGSSGQKARR
jgi:hypothetical protein